MRDGVRERSDERFATTPKGKPRINDRPPFESSTVVSFHGCEAETVPTRTPCHLVRGFVCCGSVQAVEDTSSPDVRTTSQGGARRVSDELSFKTRRDFANCTVAVVVSSTTRGIKDVRWGNIALSSIMLPSLKKTIEPDYMYTLYVGDRLG